MRPKKAMKKKLRAVNVDDGLIARVDLWRANQDVAPTRVACVETALKEFLDRRKKAK